jgi:putative hydrolase of the HAD superfamily
MTTQTPVQALLFDLGGVVIDIDFTRVYRHWAQFSPFGVDEIAERCLFDATYQRYERAETDDTTFFAHVRERLSLDADDETIIEGWNTVFVDQNRAVLAMIAQVSQHYPTFAFTNTSASHQAAWSSRYPDVVNAFRKIFSSAEMGMRKPELAAYRHVVDAIGCDAGSVLFFDDMAANIAGAQAAGLQAVRVTHSADVETALQRLGAL